MNHRTQRLASLVERAPRGLDGALGVLNTSTRVFVVTRLRAHTRDERLEVKG